MVLPPPRMLLLKKRKPLFRSWSSISKLMSWMLNKKRMPGGSGRERSPRGPGPEAASCLHPQPGFQTLQQRSRGPQAPH